MAFVEVVHGLYKEKKIRDAVIFICACRIGPMISANIRKIHKLGATLIINPDGHEWLRAKWNSVIKTYWKYSEKLCVKNADLLICDSVNIEKYIKEHYAIYNPRTTFIAYGSDISKSKLSLNDSRVVEWFQKWEVEPGNYYVNIARIVPENNYETMVREFMASSTDKSFVIVASLKGNKYYEQLKKQLHFENDKRIKFVDGIYDQELLKIIRENAFGYIHGHSVGGTNPSLLEALGVLNLNLLYDSEFNVEVGKDGALYWNLQSKNLKRLIEKAEVMSIDEIMTLGERAHDIVNNFYSWKKICEDYEIEFEK